VIEADADAVVIGAGPNGLVAANLLADAGWRVVVLEAHSSPGGAVRSSELAAPGFVADWGSSFYPLGFASPVLRALHLEEHGLRWVHSPLPLAHPTPGGCAFVDRLDLDATASSLDAFAPGDGDRWRTLYRRWQKLGPAFLDMLLSPFPPVRKALRVGAVANVHVPWLTWFALASLRTAIRRFDGDGARLLLAGNTMHTDLTPNQATGALFGWLLASLAQDVGFPVPEGGAGRLTDALVARLEAHGGALRYDTTVTRIQVRGGRAVAVDAADGTTLSVRHAVLADTSAPTLYTRLLAEQSLPARVRRGLRRFRWDHATVKVDWALDGRVPWTQDAARGGGTVHLADSIEDIAAYCDQISQGLVPARPFLVVGQMSTTDPTRSPPGTEALWAYTHVPQEVQGDAGTGITGRWDDSDAQRIADRIEGELERRAPGFRSLVRGRAVITPRAFEAQDPNLVGGALNGGTAALRQQLFLRPVLGLRGGARTFVRGCYLASAAAHPGGGVHGACGANAAHLALQDTRH
jgi:phytoene dehydrogenase-like protein